MKRKKLLKLDVVVTGSESADLPEGIVVPQSMKSSTTFCHHDPIASSSFDRNPTVENHQEEGQDQYLLGLKKSWIFISPAFI